MCMPGAIGLPQIFYNVIYPVLCFHVFIIYTYLCELIPGYLSFVTDQ